MWRSTRPTPVLSARLFPASAPSASSGDCDGSSSSGNSRGGGILELRVKKPRGFRFTSGQYIHLCCPAISSFEYESFCFFPGRASEKESGGEGEKLPLLFSSLSLSLTRKKKKNPIRWHPFTLASAPQDPFLTVVMKVSGRGYLFQVFHFEREGAGHRDCFYSSFSPSPFFPRPPLDLIPSSFSSSLAQPPPQKKGRRRLDARSARARQGEGRGQGRQAAAAICGGAGSGSSEADSGFPRVFLRRRCGVSQGRSCCSGQVRLWRKQRPGVTAFCGSSGSGGQRSASAPAWGVFSRSRERQLALRSASPPCCCPRGRRKPPASSSADQEGLFRRGESRGVGGGGDERGRRRRLRQAAQARSFSSYSSSYSFCRRWRHRCCCCSANKQRSQ